jgi:hypothetical protein
MKATGYALLALAALLCVYAGMSHLIFDATPIEQTGTERATGSSGSYWLALIPATVAAGIGLYMVLNRQRGYRTTYDLGEQQTSWNA